MPSPHSVYNTNTAKFRDTFNETCNAGDDADPDSPPSDPLPSPGSVKVEPSSLLFPQFPLPLAPFPLPPSPLPYLGPASPGPDTQGFRLVLPATVSTSIM